MEGADFLEISVPTYMIKNVTFHDTAIRMVNENCNISTSSGYFILLKTVLQLQRWQTLPQ